MKTLGIHGIYNFHFSNILQKIQKSEVFRFPGVPQKVNGIFSIRSATWLPRGTGAWGAKRSCDLADSTSHAAPMRQKKTRQLKEAVESLFSFGGEM